MAKAKPLKASERKWLLELEALLLRCPKRLELFTIGDSRLTAIDRNEFSQANEQSEMLSCSLGEISSGCRIHGISG